MGVAVREGKGLSVAHGSGNHEVAGCLWLKRIDNGIQESVRRHRHRDVVDNPVECINIGLSASPYQCVRGGRELNHGIALIGKSVDRHTHFVGVEKYVLLLTLMVVAQDKNRIGPHRRDRDGQCNHNYATLHFSLSNSFPAPLLFRFVCALTRLGRQKQRTIKLIRRTFCCLYSPCSKLLNIIAK